MDQTGDEVLAEDVVITYKRMREVILLLRLITDKSMQKCKTTYYIGFIHLEKAFDNIN